MFSYILVHVAYVAYVAARHLQDESAIISTVFIYSLQRGNKKKAAIKSRCSLKITHMHKYIHTQRMIVPLLLLSDRTIGNLLAPCAAAAVDQGRSENKVYFLSFSPLPSIRFHAAA